ncbi:MAG: DUF3488 and transglutaminase-like domain-containing protein [Acidimicrobiales bacterium]
MSSVGTKNPLGHRPPAKGPAVTPWLLLTATDVVAVCTLARCFSGPGEVAVAVPACVVVHLLAGGARRLPGLSAARGRGLLLGRLGWALGLLGAFALPLVAIDGHSFSFGLPLSATWQLVGHQLGFGWSIFSHKVAPVIEAPGLVVVTGWAAGAMALASEVLYADAGLPAILALVPAFDIVVFTGTLGTSTGRAVEIAVVAGLALGFLVASEGDRAAPRTVMMARAEGGLAGDTRARYTAPRKKVLPGVTIVAALAAGVIGPVLPGATSAPLVAWHGLAAGRANRTAEGGGSPGSGSQPNKIMVSGLVEVAEQEVTNSNGLLFTVHSTQRTRESLFTLDHFDGVRWSRVAARAGQSLAVPQFPGSVIAIARHPPPSRVSPDGSEQLDQAIEIAGLGGPWLPSPGPAKAVDGDGNVSQLGSNGPLVASAPLTSSLTYSVRAELPPTAASLLSSESAFGSPLVVKEDLQLPQPVPRELVGLAHSIVGGALSQYTAAARLQDFFLTGHGFAYRLPTVTPSGAIANTSQSYEALKAFLFHSRVGYCQQYATAFAVLARIVGLPTRIAIGFLPGRQIAKNEFVVTGAQVHAWPEVFLAQYGWVSFEPTPGVLPLSSPPGPGLPNKSGTGSGVTAVTVPPGLHAPNFKGPPGSTGAPLHRSHHRFAQRAARQIGSTGVVDIVITLLGLGIAWVLGVPAWRSYRRRRDRRDVRRATVAAWRAAVWVLAAASAHRRRAETHLEFVDRVRRLGLLSDAGNEALDKLAERMDRTLYGPEGAESALRADAVAAWAESATVRRSARRRIAWWQQAFLLVDPRDLLGPG